jgi:hypothetical protein
MESTGKETGCSYVAENTSKRRKVAKDLFRHRTFAAEDTTDEPLNYFKTYQYLHIRRQKSPLPRHIEVFKSIVSFIEKNPKTFEAFQIDNMGTLSSEIRSSQVFCHPEQIVDGSWYVSAILQTDPDTEEGKRLSVFIKTLPVISPSAFGAVSDLEYDNAIWMFCGRHEASTIPMQLMGRREHTDSVECSGTWHYQLLGEKIWRLRPDEDSGDWVSPVIENATISPSHSDGVCLEKGEDGVTRLSIRCQEGDLLAVNTKIWKHHTEIPLLISTAQGHQDHREESTLGKCNSVNLSFSYARDFVARSLHSSIAVDMN